MQHWRVMQLGVNTPLTALTFCQHFYSLFKELKGNSAGACIRPYRGKFESCFLSGREGGNAIVPAETMGAAGRHAAVRT